jgi:hypothetical protein
VSVLLGNGDGTFQSAVNFTVGTDPNGVAVADVKGDGRLDLVTANLRSNNVSVLLNNRAHAGTGTFQSAVNFAVGNDPRSVAVADVNGDGRPDLVTANANSNTVSVLLGNGNGTFQSAVNFAVGTNPLSVAVADVNGDGRPDLVVANELGNTVSLLLGNGDGTFQSAVNFAVGKGPRGVAVADVNGDGHPDLVVANLDSHSVSVLLGNGNGTFQSAVNFAVGVFPNAVGVADVNGDGRPDLVVTNDGTNSVSVLLGNGNGTFQSAVNYGVGPHPNSVAVADVNGDGHPDLVVANYGSSSSPGDTVSVLLGNGDGTFQSAVNYTVGKSPLFLAVADVNGDGHPDLITANLNSNTVSVLLGNGNGTFQAAQNFGVGAYPTAVAVGDVNGDGIPDVVAANLHGSNVSVLLGNRNAATHFKVTAPASVTAGKSFTITVTALTAGKQLDAVYTGTVHFTSSDSSAILPADYTFTLRDAGSHKFKVTLNTAGSQTITATDTVTSSITGQATVNTAGPPPAPSRSSGGEESAGVAATLAATLLPTPATQPTADGFLRADAVMHPVLAVWTPTGSPTIRATETARQATPTWPVHAAVWTAHVGQSFDPEGDLLSPAATEAYFAQNGFAGKRQII